MTEQNHSSSEAAKDGIAAQLGRIDALAAQAWDVRRTDRSAAIQILAEVRGLLGALPAPYTSGEAGVLVTESWLDAENGQFLFALERLFQARTLLLPAKEVRALYVIGEVYAALQSPFHALQYYEQAHALARTQDVLSIEAASLRGMGSMYLALGGVDRARGLLDDSLALARELDAPDLVADALLGHADVCLAQADHPATLAATEEALQVYEAAQLPAGQCSALLALGRIHLKMGALRAGLDCALQAIKLATTHQHNPLLVQGRTLLAEHHKAAGRLPAAVENLTEALRMADAGQLPDLGLHCHQLMGEIYSRTGAYEQAAYHLQAALSSGAALNADRSRAAALTLQASTGGSPAEQLTHYKRRNQELVRELEDKHRAVVELDNFARNVAHDLKSPLSIITGYGELVMNDVLQLDDPNLIRRMEQILEAAFKTNHIIDELLLLAGVSKQRVTLQPLDMMDIVREVERRILRVMTAEHPIEIVKPRRWPKVLGHAPWVEQVWANYISNAIKYGGTPPRLEVGATPEVDGYVRFWVKDNGDGINVEAQDQLFNAFERLGNTRVTGHGLGLSIVKNIVEKLGGEVGIESVPGHGSTFSFTLQQADRQTQSGRLPML